MATIFSKAVLTSGHLFDLAFNSCVNGYMGQRAHDITLKLDFVGSPLSQVGKFECVVNMIQVHVVLDCPRKQLLFIRNVAPRFSALGFVTLKSGWLGCIVLGV